MNREFSDESIVGGVPSLRSAMIEVQQAAEPLLLSHAADRVSDLDCRRDELVADAP